MAAPDKRLGTVQIDDARIIFRNFAGKEGQYNREGDRNFGVVLPIDIALQMEEDGWNIKYLKAREEGEEPTPWVQVAVSYKGRPPRVVMITHRGNPPEPVRTTLPEELVELLDYADLSTVDLILNPYQWAVSGKTGVKAYLKTIFAKVQQDELERRYADLEEISFDGRPLQIEAGPGDDEIIIEEDQAFEDAVGQLEQYAHRER
jgi:hypothetical protein